MTIIFCEIRVSSTILGNHTPSKFRPPGNVDVSRQPQQSMHGHIEEITCIKQNCYSLTRPYNKWTQEDIFQIRETNVTRKQRVRPKF